MGLAGISEEDLELLGEFINESYEQLSSAQQSMSLLSSKSETNSKGGHIAQLFRTFHTIKGTAGFFILPELQNLAHTSEDLLDILRSNPNLINEEIIDMIQKCILVMITMINELKVDGEEQSIHPDALENFLEEIKSQEESLTRKVQAEQNHIQKFKDSSHHQIVKQRSSIKIPFKTIESLHELTGALTLAQNQISHSISGPNRNSLLHATDQLYQIMVEFNKALHESSITTLEKTFRGVAKITKYVAKSCQKQIELLLKGNKLEVDRLCCEAVKEPLLHLIRNAIDHGIESYEQRRKKGKPAVGRIHISAKYELKSLIISIQDDGQGLNINAIKSKAISVGLITETQSEHLTEEEIKDLIFSPGFSTAMQINEISGRGVGMDVIRNSLNEFGGQIEVNSTIDRGCEFRLKIPVKFERATLLPIELRGQWYYVRAKDIQKYISLFHTDNIEISYSKENKALNVEGDIVKLISFSESLSFKENTESSISEKHLLIYEAQDSRYGLVVNQTQATTSQFIYPIKNFGMSEDKEIFCGIANGKNNKINLVIDLEKFCNETQG